MRTPPRLMQIKLAREDPFEALVAAMVEHLHKTSRGALKLWFLKQCRTRLGNGTAMDMAQRLKDDLMGDTLEDGHQRDQERSRPLQQPRTSQPLRPPPPSAPISTPLPEPDLRHAREDREAADDSSDLMF